MAIRAMTMAKAPHLTPQNLIGLRFARDFFGPAKVALIGYCPPPSVLERYVPARVEGQPFIHVSPDSARILSYGERRFLSLAHVYGGPVSSATVEELAYYGFEAILAYGLAGGLGTNGLAMGDFYLVHDAYAADGTTRHYTRDSIMGADRRLSEKAKELWPAGHTTKKLISVRAATGDAIYREDDEMLNGFRSQGCDIVNLDSAHLYAVARENAEGRRISALQCGVISDVVHAGPDMASESALSAMLAGGDGGFNPLEQTGDIVTWYIERLAPALGY
jgi:uridine phosphorylase